MIICTKCGADNQLGRVFCMSCGTKLDLTHVSTEAIAQENKTSWIGMHWPKLVLIPILLLLLVSAGLIFWANTELIGEKGNIAGSRRVESMLIAAVNARSGGSAVYQCKEPDVNAYLENVVSRKSGAAVYVTFHKGLVTARLVKLLTKAGPVTIAISCDAKCLPEGGRLVVKQATLGHLKLFGPLMSVANSLYAGALSVDSQLVNLKGVSDIKVEDGVMSFGVKK